MGEIVTTEVPLIWRFVLFLITLFSGGLIFDIWKKGDYDLGMSLMLLSLGSIIVLSGLIVFLKKGPITFDTDILS